MRLAVFYRERREIYIETIGEPGGSGGFGIRGSMEKILIVEDDRLHAARLKTILEDEYEITLAETAEEGLYYIGTDDFSLILADIILPGMSGFTMLEKLQEEFMTQSIPVILFTSLCDVEDEQRGLSLGAVDYITKPCHPLILKARVKTHIKLYNYRKQVEHQSRIDQLTGVANRRQHDYYSAVKWSEAARLKIPFTVCMFDIDRFKVYNDTFGHPEGDKVITAVARTASRHLQRSTDFFARYGGEEFVALMLGDNSDVAFEHLKKIRQAIEDLHIPHPDSVSPWVTVSIGGVTVIPEPGSSYSFYLKIADTMLYDAKNAGRNRVIWADEKMKQMYEK